MVWGLDKGSFFAFGCSIDPAPFDEEDLFFIELLLHFCEKTIGHICVRLFLDSIFCSTDLCIYRSTNTTLPWLLRRLYSSPYCGVEWLLYSSTTVYSIYTHTHIYTVYTTVYSDYCIMNYCIVLYFSFPGLF